MRGVSYDSKRYRQPFDSYNFSIDDNERKNKVIYQPISFNCFSPSHDSIIMQHQNRLLSEKLSKMISDRKSKIKSPKNIEIYQSRYKNNINKEYKYEQKNFGDYIQRNQYFTPQKYDNSLELRGKNRQILGQQWLRKQNSKVMAIKAKYQSKPKHLDIYPQTKNAHAITINSIINKYQNSNRLKQENKLNPFRLNKNKQCLSFQENQKQYIKNKTREIQGFIRYKEAKSPNIIHKQKYYRASSQESQKDSIVTTKKRSNKMYLKQCKYFEDSNTERALQTCGSDNHLNKFPSKQRNANMIKPQNLKCDVYLQGSTIFIQNQKTAVFQEESFGGKKKQLHMLNSQNLIVNDAIKSSEFKLKKPQFKLKDYLQNNPIPKNLKTQPMKKSDSSDNILQRKSRKKTNRPYIIQESDFKLNQPKTQLKKINRNNLKVVDQECFVPHNFDKILKQNIQAINQSKIRKTVIQENQQHVNNSYKKRRQKKTYLSLTSKSVGKYR